MAKWEKRRVLLCVGVVCPFTLIDMCLCVYGQRGVLNLQPHIKMLQSKMAALAQLRPQQHFNYNKKPKQRRKKGKKKQRPKIKRLQNTNYNKRRRFNGNK